ncbi:hypothetical protein BDV93DRAFT_525948 [Ceratobasidium sp. AG-I]|nr:hypothetical protein BDV93DRAFT_525948 [Ceratobasidium sp. AG-I]
MRTVTEDTDCELIGGQLLSLSLSSDETKSHSQPLPAEVLALIVEALSFYPTELFAPLICSRVCSYWRRSIYETSSLWSFIDTSRGPRFTQLWLTNSKQSLLDIRISDQSIRKKYLKYMPLHCPSPSSPLQHHFDPIPENIKSQAHRWRSLDISLSCTGRVSRALLFLTHSAEALHLDSLTVGPMGKSILANDYTIERLLLQKLNAQPTVLRIDNYFGFLCATMVSPRLTVLELFLGGDLKHQPDAIDWPLVLSTAPNLIELSLLESRHKHDPLLKYPEDRSSFELLNLRKLSLSGRFTQLCELFATSALPMLQHLSLDTLPPTTAILPKHLASIASTSPQLSHVSVGSMPYAAKDGNATWWEKAFQPLLPSLRELVFVEMEWREVAVALDSLTGLPHQLSLVRLEQIWDLQSYDWTRLYSSEIGMPTIETTNSVYGGVGWCRSQSDVDHACESGAESNYSDDNSAHYTPGVYPSSEELDSDESEISYDGSDDNLRSSGDEHEDDDDEVDLCMWGTGGLAFP